jgi:hypothetical protein
MHHVAMISLLSAACLLPATFAPGAAAAGPPVNAGGPSEQQLYAPDDRDSFDLMIFGDRTGGPREGIEVLKQAVQMANDLDVDLVTTVGDLIEGYNQPDQWRIQMREYKDVVKDLRMPWYPCAGNHDVYARPDRARGNMDLYTKHFGPLYYSFDYKWAHFIVLFSDEALSFREPAKNQNFSPQQMQWLGNDLAATEAAQIFVFLHHPRWTKRYTGCNWDDIHRMFVSDGRPITVFGGHIHTYRSDGWIDNVHYYTLATTGGHLGRLQQSAALHHVNFVRVRPEGTTVAVLPVGSVINGDFVLGREVDVMDELSRGGWVELDGQAMIATQPGQRSTFTVRLTNPAEKALRCTAELKCGPGWALDVEQIDRRLAPGDSIRVDVEATAPALSAPEPRITLRSTMYYALESGLTQPIEIERQVPMRVILPDEVKGPDPANNGVLALDGSSALRVEVPHGLQCYTLECWVRGEPPKDTMALLSKTEGSGYGLFWSAAWEGFEMPVGYAGMTEGYATLRTTAPWDWGQWTHVALVYDGRKAALYTNGRLQAEQATTSPPRDNHQPLYVGADPNWHGQPSRMFTGMVDEVRLSSTARYAGPFAPQSGFERDEQTVLLLHFDRDFGALYPDDSGGDRHGWAAGSPRIERVAR